MKKNVNLILSIVLLSILSWNCSNDLSPVKFDKSSFPQAPSELKIFIGDGSVVIRWSHTDIAGVDFFNIFRKNVQDSGFTKIDTTSLLEYIDSNVNNSITYNYAISAVKDGVEGAKAFSTNAMPTVFGIQINSGAEFTNSRTVVLTLIAPLGTTFMRIANDSTFVSSIWEPYAASKIWTLTENDGPKSVYVHYRDAEENQTISSLSAQVLLDTKAEILDFTHDAVNVTRSTGDTIKFTMDAGEVKGTASIDIGSARTNIRLFDNATNGDDIKDDGVYHRNFVVPPTFEVINTSVIGHFSDQLGNIAEDFQAKGLISIQNSPNMVTLLNPEQIPGSFRSLRLTWTRSMDSDFASYKLYRSTSSGVTNDSTFVTSIESVNTLSHVNSDLNENTVYYYRLYVFDTNGNNTPSNEVSGNTLQNLPPDPVTLISAVASFGTSRSLEITWTRNEDDDFANYSLYRSKTTGVDLNSTLVSTISSASTLNLTDTTLEENTTYFYKMYVFDAGGLSSNSNEVSGTTNENIEPEAITVFNPTPVANSTTSLKLSWTQSPDNDFASYKIYRALSSPVAQDCTFVESIESVSVLTNTDDNLKENTTYFYKIYVFDTGGLFSQSNEVSGKTSRNEPPEAVSLLPIEIIQGSTTSLRLAWTQNNDQDFASYKVYRSLTPGVTTSSVFVASLENRTTLNYTDVDLDENTLYYYKVYIFDTGGLSSPSNEMSGQTPVNEPPEAVSLLPVEIIQGSTTSLRLTWTQNNDQDFSSYKIYRSLTPGVTTNSVFVASLENKATLNYTDEDLDENTVYYYNVYIFDTGGLSSPSNEMSGQTPINEPPEAVSLLPVEIIQGSTTSLRLAWTQNNDSDFASYKIYRSLTSGVTTNSVFVASIENNSQLSFTDLDLTENTVYFYKVYVFDTSGKSTPSNEESGQTPVNEPPAAITLFKPESLESTPTTLRVSWTKNNDSDFANYKIYRAKTSNVTTLSTFVTSIENSSQISYLDEELDENTTYFYKIYVFDTGGLSTESNEEFGATLANTPPSPVTLTQPNPINATTLRLSWSQSAEGDFESYRVYRSVSSPVDTTAAPIGIENSISTTTYDDSNITTGIDYFYRVFVFDTNGLSAGSNEVTGKL